MKSAMNSEEPTAHKLRDLAAAHDENGDVNEAITLYRHVLSLVSNDRITSLRLAKLLHKNEVM